MTTLADHRVEGILFESQDGAISIVQKLSSQDQNRSGQWYQ